MGLLSGKLSPQSLITVCYNLAGMHRAGIPILQSLELAAEQSHDKMAKKTLYEMAERIREGATLTEAAESQKRRIPDFVIQHIAAGEVGGYLDLMFQDLATYYETRQNIARELKSFLFFPFIYVALAWILGTLVAAAFQASSGNSIDKVLFCIAFLKMQFPVIFVVLVLVILYVILERLGLMESITASAKNKLWLLNSVEQQYAMARFFRCFAVLVGAGIDARKSLRNAAAVTRNPVIRKELMKAVPHIQNGRTFEEAFSQVKATTPLDREMLDVGEISGRLNEVLLKVSEMHIEKADHDVVLYCKVFAFFMLVITVFVAACIILSSM